MDSRLKSCGNDKGKKTLTNLRNTIAAFLTALLFFFSVWASQGWAASGRFEITEALMSSTVDKARTRPAKATSEFPKGTASVYCWFSWRNAEPNLVITARWHYTSADVHILDSPISLTRAADSGILSLRMPEGKTLPPGEYRLDFEWKGKTIKRTIKSVAFRVSS